MLMMMQNMTHSNSRCQLIQGFDLPIYHCGPPLEEGALPSLFYFSLSGEESLTLDPYNQPVTLLTGHNNHRRLRVFSLNLPGHGHGLVNAKALAYWAENIAAGHDIISAFIDSCRLALDFLVNKGYIDPDHIAVAGLSRGAFIATHFAAADHRIKTVLGFAPLTRLDGSKDFADIAAHPLVQELSLRQLADKLAAKTLRFYIGNRDTCVGTENCFTFIKQLAETAYAHHHRSPPVELIIYPSIGHQGHGTPPHIFQAGSDWLLSHMVKPGERAPL